jgi:hypothetical protein
MMNHRFLVLVATMLSSLTWAQEAASSVATESECVRRFREGMPDGPVNVGLGTADFGVGRRVCARSEISLGGKFGAVIDTPDFYGDLAASGIIAGSFAITPDTELFATLEAVSFRYTVNAVLSTTQLKFGHLTVGASHQVFEREHLVGALTGRVLLPTSFEIPNVRTTGAEIGFNVSQQALRWIEIHGYFSTDVTFGLSNAASLPSAGFSVLGGVQLIPFSWLSAVIDLNGHVGTLNYLAPAVALRANILRFGIELGGTLPVIGNDRHDFLAHARFSFRLD